MTGGFRGFKSAEFFIQSREAWAIIIIGGFRQKNVILIYLKKVGDKENCGLIF